MCTVDRGCAGVLRVSTISLDFRFDHRFHSLWDKKKGISTITYLNLEQKLKLRCVADSSSSIVPLCDRETYRFALGEEGTIVFVTFFFFLEGN